MDLNKQEDDDEDDEADDDDDADDDNDDHDDDDDDSTHTKLHAAYIHTSTCVLLFHGISYSRMR